MGTTIHSCGHSSRSFFGGNPTTTCPICSSDFATAGKVKDRLKGQFEARYHEALQLSLPALQHHYAIVAQYATICRSDLIKEWSNLINEGYDVDVIRGLINQALTRTNCHEWIHAKGKLAGLKALANR